MGLFDSLWTSGDQSRQPQGGLLGIDPMNLALLAAGAAGLEAGGPSLKPVSTGQAIGRMVNTGLGAYSSALGNQMKQDEMQQMADYRKAQAAQLNQKVADQKELNDFFKSRLTMTPGLTPSADMAASVTALGHGAQYGDIGPTVTNAARMDAIRPSQLQGQNSAFPFSLNDIAYLKTKGVDLSDAYKLATDPIQLTGGSVYRDRVTGQERYIPKLPDGMALGSDGKVTVLPGYITGNDDIKSGEAFSQEIGKAKLDPFYTVDDRGNKVLSGSRAQALGFGSGFGGGTGPLSPPASNNGGGSGIVTERSPAATAYDTEMAKDYAARYAGINKAAFTAPNQIAKLQRIGQLLDQHDGGKFSQTGLELAQMANSLGFKLDKNLGNKEAASALSNEIALSLRDPSNGGGMPGALSDSDRQFLASMSPGLGQSKEGRTQMINAGVALQKRNQQVYAMAQKYAKKYGRVDDGFYSQLQDWSERNPLFGGGQ